MAMQVSGVLSPLFYPLIKRQEEREKQETSDLIKRAYTGDQEALIQLAQKNPALLTGLAKMKEAQQQQQEQQRIMGLVQPTVTPGAPPMLGNVPQLQQGQQPFGAGLDMASLLGAKTAIPTPQPEIIPEREPETVYPNSETLQNLAYQAAVNGNLGLAKALTEQAQAGYYGAQTGYKNEQTRQLTGDYDMRNALIGEIAPKTVPAQYPTGQDFGQWMLGGGQFPQIQPERTVYPGPEQYANVQARGGLLGDRTQDIMGGQYDLARIDEINQKIARGEALLPYEVDELKQKAIKLDAEAQQAEAAGNLSRAKSLREQAETFWLPLTKQAGIGKTTAETGKIQAQTGQIKAGGGALPVYTRDPETGELIQTGIVPKGSKVYTGKPETGTTSLPAALKTKLSDFMGLLEGNKRAGEDRKFWTKQRVSTRQEAEASARKNGLNPAHPEVKAVIDYYFPQATGQAGKFRILSVE